MLTVETKRTTQEEERRNDRGFEALGAPALSLGLDAVAFGPGPAAVKILFKNMPFVFEGANIADGTNMPNFKNVFVAQLLREIEQGLRSGQTLLSPT